MALYLHCAICSRKQADGLISGAAWGRLEIPPHIRAEGSNGTVRVCPSCIEGTPDWQTHVLSGFGLESGLRADPAR
jgi:hypothetical protein